MTSPESEPAGRSMTSTYVAVVIVEVLALLALWVFGRQFGSP
jgi:hypothetical protein